MNYTISMPSCLTLRPWTSETHATEFVQALTGDCCRKQNTDFGPILAPGWMDSASWVSEVAPNSNFLFGGMQINLLAIY